MLQFITDAETAQRGYVLTGSEEASRMLVQSGIGMEQMQELRLLMDGLVARAGDAVDASGAITLRTLAFNRFGVATLMVLSVLGLFLYLTQSLNDCIALKRRIIGGPGTGLSAARQPAGLSPQGAQARGR